MQKLLARLLGYCLLALVVAGCSQSQFTRDAQPEWKVGFFDDFDTFNPDNWQDQILWVNNEDQCYVRDNLYNTREVSNGTLKLRVIDLGVKRPCDNVDKFGNKHPDTQYVAGRIASKNRQEFIKGKWTARLRVKDSGQPGMFPAWWLLGARNNEPPVEEPDENICWPMTGSGEIDIFEHHSDGGPDHYAARAIKSLGYCDGGDWQALMLVQKATLAEYHEYSVEWSGSSLIYRLDGEEVYRNEDQGDQFPEPMFAILNFAKINDSPMTQNWAMEVDWVKHEYRP
ncbi:MAG: glycoside hydrolase family 16 protein [Gammaproteobacteria bacterium]|nr:glycoside hydrolase family 16 protein [Gammaproteobacteria bacterium]